MRVTVMEDKPLKRDWSGNGFCPLLHCCGLNVLETAWYFRTHRGLLLGRSWTPSPFGRNKGNQFQFLVFSWASDCPHSHGRCTWESEWPDMCYPVGVWGPGLMIIIFVYLLQATESWNTNLLKRNLFCVGILNTKMRHVLQACQILPLRYLDT